MTQIELDSGVSSPGMPTNARTPFFAKVASATRSQPLGPLRLSDGTVLPRPVIAYELTGPAAGPVVVALGGISAHRHVTAHEHDSTAGWWQGIVGPERAIDTRHTRVLSFDYLGGNGASSGPRNTDHDPSIAGAALSPSDQALALAHLLDHLAIDRIDGLVGASYGGMVGLAFAAHHGHRLDRLVAVSATHRSDAKSTAVRALQRDVVRLGRTAGEAHEGMVWARALAMTTYRTTEELDARFHGPPTHEDGVNRFPIERYLTARGEAFAHQFDPDAFLTLSESIDLHAVDPSHIRTPTVLVAVPTDPLIPIEHVRDLADRLAGPCQLITLPSRYGHDAFLKEDDALGLILRRHLLNDSGSRSTAP